MLNQRTKNAYGHSLLRRPFLPELGARIGLLAAFAAVYLIWGSTFLAIHFAVASIPPFLMAGARFVAVAAVPMWTVLIDATSNKKWPSHTVIAGVGLGLLGVALLIGPTNIPTGNSRPLLAMLVILAGTFSWSLGTHYSRRAVQPASQNLATGLNLLAGGFLLLLFGGARGEYVGLALVTITLKSALAFGYLILFGSIVGFSVYMWLVKVTTPARASSNFYVNPWWRSFWAGCWPASRSRRRPWSLTP